MPDPALYRRWLPFLMLLASVVLPAGCDFGASPKRTKTTAPRPVALKLAVVGDEAIAEAVRPLKAEWQARTGSAFEVRTLKVDQLAELKSLTDDAVIFPGEHLGGLVERHLIGPLSPQLLRSEELAWNDLFETLQLRQATWGGEPVAVPFGTPLLVCWYRPDLFQKLDRRPPKTWTEYQQLAAYLARRENLGDALAKDAAWAGTLEPLASPWGGRLLLARAAAYAKHRDSYSTFFNIDTMQPLIDGPAFVRALGELSAAARLQPAERLDPAGIRREFLAGHAAMALTWPTGADRKVEQPTETPVAFVELPGSDKVYSVATKRWEQRGRDEEPRVSLIGFSGRLGAVSATSSYPDEALQLLGWLSAAWGQRVSAASPDTTIYRHSQMASPDAWVDAGIESPAARSYAESVEQSLSRPENLLILRIPAADEYLQALDEAVAAVLAGDSTANDSADKAAPEVQAKHDQERAATALAAVAKRWNEITDRLGREAQRTAYRRSLGLEP